MDILHLLLQNFITPAVLFFVLGVAAGFFRSDLEIPDSISRYLSIYLMMAIGFKGGVAMAMTPDLGGAAAATMLGGIVFGFLQPFVGYVLLRKTSGLDAPTAAAVAAHYGSISMVTFVAAASFLNVNDIVYAGYIVAVLALMEAPAIMSGLFIARREAPATANHPEGDRRLKREIFTNGAILLLLGAFAIGWLTGERGMEKMHGFLVLPFDGILALFLLDMGLLVAKNLHHLRLLTRSVIAFAIYMPLVSSLVGMGLARVIGLDLGTGFLLMILFASASYIAVPAAMRIALPEAKASVYVPLSIGVTFPLNLTLGIPFYYLLAQKFLG